MTYENEAVWHTNLWGDGDSVQMSRRNTTPSLLESQK